MMRGNRICRRPALTCWIVRPEPQVITRATASPGPATGSGTSTSSNGVFGPRSSIAFMETPARVLDRLPSYRSRSPGCRAAGPSWSFRLDARLCHHGGPFLGLGRKEAAERIGRHRLRLRAELFQGLTHLRRVHAFVERGVELG